MLTTSSFSKSNKYYVNDKFNRKKTNSNRQKNHHQHLKYEYSTDILDNLISIKHDNKIESKFKLKYHNYDLEIDNRDYNLKKSSSLPSIRSYYAEVRIYLKF